MTRRFVVLCVWWGVEGPPGQPLPAYFVVPDATKKAMDRDVQAVEERAQQRAQHIHDILNGTATAEVRPTHPGRRVCRSV